MVVTPNLIELKAKRDNLLQEQTKLIQNIKAKYPMFFHYVTEKGIDLTNLSKYSANIGAAFMISVGGSSINLMADEMIFRAQQKTENRVAANNPDNPEQYEIKEVTLAELQGLDDTARAKLIWDRYGSVIAKVSKKYRVDSKIIMATIMTESQGNARAIRHEPQINDASYGLGQILYGTAVGIGFEGQPADLFDPEKNIELIARYHRRNMDVYGPELQPQQLATAYNAGSPFNTPYPGHIKKFMGWYNQLGEII